MYAISKPEISQVVQIEQPSRKKHALMQHSHHTKTTDPMVSVPAPSDSTKKTEHTKHCHNKNSTLVEPSAEMDIAMEDSTKVSSP